jgi:hypothetical protein
MTSALHGAPTRTHTDSVISRSPSRSRGRVFCVTHLPGETLDIRAARSSAATIEARR